jgi:hypothetical protein
MSVRMFVPPEDKPEETFTLKLTREELRTIYDSIKLEHYYLYIDSTTSKIVVGKYEQDFVKNRMSKLEKLWKVISDEMGWDPP